MRERRRPRQLERGEQAQIVRLLSAVRAEVWITGTTRKRGSACPACGTFVPQHQGTMMTPGIADVFAFLPPRPASPSDSPDVLLVVEAKAPRGRLGGATRPGEPDQVRFRAACLRAEVDHVVGGFDAVLAWLVHHGYLSDRGVAYYRPLCATKEDNRP